MTFSPAVKHQGKWKSTLWYVRLSPEEDDVGGLEDEEEEEEDVLMGKEVFPRREEGASTLERLRGITALGGGATLPW